MRLTANGQEPRGSRGATVLLPFLLAAHQNREILTSGRSAASSGWLRSTEDPARLAEQEPYRTKCDRKHTENFYEIVHYYSFGATPISGLLIDRCQSPQIKGPAKIFLWENFALDFAYYCQMPVLSEQLSSPGVVGLRAMQTVPDALRFPVVSHGAEFLVQGYLMLRNILTYKAPPNNEGYDLVCIHPDPHTVTRQIRVQVKSRYATDCDHGFPVKEKTFTAFDFLIAAFLNVGNFGGKGSHNCLAGRRVPEFYTFPVSFIREHHDKTSSWEKVRLGKLSIDEYKGDKGFELIAQSLGIPYPARPELAASKPATQI